MDEVVFLGTGGPLSTPERDNTSFLVHSDNRATLIDCPGSVLQKLMKVAVSPLEVRDVFITHVHPDHVYGLPGFVLGLMLYEHRIKLYGSEETIAFCRNLLDLFRLREPHFKTRVDFVPLETENPVTVSGGMEVTAHRVPHHSSSLAFEFQLENKGTRLVFSGDTPPHPAFFTRIADADYLFHDCSAPSRLFALHPVLTSKHTHSLDLGKWSAEARIRCCVPCHFLAEFDFPLVEIEAEIRKNYGGSLVLPMDLERLNLE